MTARDPSSWILTFTGVQFYPTTPNAEDIHIKDIAHALAGINRFLGHSRSYINVAEHSFRVSHDVSEQDALWGLLHDAAEAYLGDLPTPLKYHTPMGKLYREYEDRLMRLICQRFGLPERCPASVAGADHRQLQREWEHLMDPATKYDWRKRVTPMEPHEAEDHFLNRYRELTGDRHCER
jgi:hypothetical protein